MLRIKHKGDLPPFVTPVAEHLARTSGEDATKSWYGEDESKKN
jgi:hypothetical protein